MIHIMHIIESLEFGGAEKVVVHLANKLSINHKVSICVTKREGALVNDLSENIDVYCLNSPEGNNYSLPAQIRKLLVNKNVDILHSHNWGIFLEAALAVRKVSHIKLISTIHGPYNAYSPGLKSKIKITVRHLAEKYLSKFYYKIIAVSASIKDYIIKDIGINKSLLITVFNGLDDIGPNLVDKKSTKVHFITVGRLAKIKNHSLMLSAFKKVLESGYDFYFTIVGDGPEKSNLIQYCQEFGLSEYVYFLGFRTDIKEILSTHDVFLLSSDYEGISIALLESMSLSMPAISTSVGGIPETIIDNKSGYLVPSNNVDIYAEKIINFINAPSNIGEMGENAREYFLKEFQEDVVLSKYSDIYKQSLSCINEK